MAADETTSPIAYTRLRVVLDGGPQPWAVPIDYYRLLRSADPQLAGFLHLSGFSAEAPAIDFRPSRDLAACPGPAAEAFKLFCFSSLIGDGTLRQGRLVFDQPVVWFVATPLRFLAQALTRALGQTGTLRIGRVDLKVSNLRPLDEPAIDPSLTGLLLSPLVIGAPDPTTKRRRYLTREDGIVLTEARLRGNLLAKHRALHGIEPADPEFQFLWTAASTFWPTPDRPTRLVRLSGPRQPSVQVRGSLGAVTLAGSPELLQLALHAGLGQYNASGMGFLLPEADSQLLQI